MVRELKPCKEGWVRNPLTNRCQKIRAEGEKAPRVRKKKELKACPEGSERNPATNRCRKIKVEGEKAPRAPRKAREKKPCKETQFRNVETGRCKKIRAESKAKVATKPQKPERIIKKSPVAQEIQAVKRTKKMTPKTAEVVDERKGIKEQIVELSREYNEKYGREGINKQYLTKENKAEFTKASFALADQILSLIKEGGVEGWANFDDDASKFKYNKREFRGRVRRRM